MGNTLLKTPEQDKLILQILEFIKKIIRPETRKSILDKSLGKSGNLSITALVNVLDSSDAWKKFMCFIEEEDLTSMLTNLPPSYFKLMSIRMCDIGELRVFAQLWEYVKMCYSNASDIDMLKIPEVDEVMLGWK
jgi:hypothetical protein